MFTLAAIAATLISVSTAQQIGTYQTETHPSLTWSSCTSSGCTTNSGSIVLDANWRWVHLTSNYTNCYTDNYWNASLCGGTATSCATECALDGAAYSSTYGITTSGNQLKLDFVTNNGNDYPNVGSRVYLLASTNTYETFNLHNREFTFTVDVSQLDCGLNGAVYFSQMDADGGMARFPNNKAGAAYGTGYCDSQCPRDLKFISGQANIVNWTATDSVSGVGSLGSCCNEMDIWEANKWDNAVTPHPCETTAQTACTGSQCTGTLTTGLCDPAGCDFNPYRMGVESFFGPGLTINTNSPFTVVTQFITADGTDSGALTAIKRFYIQNGVVYAQPAATNINDATNEITDSFCSAQKTAFGDDNIFAAKGGFSTFSEYTTDMVLVLSLWDDHTANMLWLDSDYPVGRSTSQAGTVRGPCSTSSGVPATVESSLASAYVIYSDIRFGTINSTFSASSVVTSSTTTSHSTSSTSTTSQTTTTSHTTSSSGTCSALYGQCGGVSWNGPTCCVSGSTCTYFNPYYSQCLP